MNLCLQEGLYSDDLQARSAAVAKICVVFQDSTNLTVLLQRPALLSVLARLMREDGRKSLDLSLSTVGLFCALSYFTQLQGMLLEHQVGARTLDILTFSIQRACLQVSLSGTSFIDPSGSPLHKQTTHLRFAWTGAGGGVCVCLLFRLPTKQHAVCITKATAPVLPVHQAALESFGQQSSGST